MRTKLQPKIWTLVSSACFALATLIATSGTAVAADENPYLKADGTWITISGTVDSVDRDKFLLDYGEGYITVEMDDGDRDADAYKLIRGDEVIVTGVIDDDFYETTSIEAGSVYVENLNTTFFADVTDERYLEILDSSVVTPFVVSRTMVRGTVTAVADDEFTLDTGIRKLQVDVEDMAYNPLDDEGYQKIEVGDRVRVVGDLEDDLFEEREFDASVIVKLQRSAS